MQLHGLYAILMQFKQYMPNHKCKREKYPSLMLRCHIALIVNVEKQVKTKGEKIMQKHTKKKLKKEKQRKRKRTLGCLPSSASFRSLFRP